MADKSKKAGSEAAEGDDAVKRFIDELKASPAEGHVLHAMVKPAEGDDGLMVAHPGNCDHWILIPSAAIDSIERKGSVGCGAHAHPVAAIQLKAPQSDLEKALAGVAGLHQTKLLQMLASAQAISPCNPPCPPGKSCQQDQWQNWICV